jgi:hypothetical protein
MANEAVATVGMMDVRSQQAGHQSRKLLWVGQLQQQMEVVGHQAVVVEAEGEALAVVGQQAKEVSVVIVIDEDGVAVVTSVKDVVAGGFGPLPTASKARHRLPSVVLAKESSSSRIVLVAEPEASSPLSLGSPGAGMGGT